jgi:hypothetical protein
MESRGIEWHRDKTKTLKIKQLVIEWYDLPELQNRLRQFNSGRGLQHPFRVFTCRSAAIGAP